MSLPAPIINDKNAAVNESACSTDVLGLPICFVSSDLPPSKRGGPSASAFHYPHIRYIRKLDIVGLLEMIDDMEFLTEFIIIMDPAN